ncbi:hypothetical protein ES707_03964 [subsurface metagenome]
MIKMRVGGQNPVRKSDWLMAAVLIVAGTAISALSLAEIRARPPAQFAQATQPTPSSPPDAQKDKPAESTPGGTRPTTPAPEPARPDPEAQKAGAQPALPPAPAEKTAPPIKDR